jgi:hypothetical protein
MFKWFRPTAPVAPPFDGLKFWQVRGVVQRAGGVLDDASITERQVILLSRHQEAFEVLTDGLSTTRYAGSVGTVGLLGLRSATVNAWALSAPGRSAVAVSAGMLTAAADALATAIATGGLFNDAYPPDPEAPPGEVPSEIAGALLGDQAGPGLTGERIELLHELYCRVASFVVAHEIAHLARQHRTVLSAAGALSEIEGIDEARQLSGGQWGQEVTRLIEFDADVHGLDMLLATERPGRPPESWTKREVGETIFLIAFAIIVTLQLIDRGEAPLMLQSRQSHPPPIWRAVFATSLLLDTLHALWPHDREHLEEHLTMAWAEAEAVAKVLGHGQGRWRDAIWGKAKQAWRLDDYEWLRKRYLEYQVAVLDPMVARAS